MPGIDESSIDPVPDWRRKVWAELSPGHRILAKDGKGRYTTVFYSLDRNEAHRWWEAIRRREGNSWKDWRWLGWYRRGTLTKLMLFPDRG